MFADDFKLRSSRARPSSPRLLTVGRAGTGSRCRSTAASSRAAGDANRTPDQPKPQAGDYARGGPGVEKICIRHHKL